MVVKTAMQKSVERLAEAIPHLSCDELTQLQFRLRVGSIPLAVEKCEFGRLDKKISRQILQLSDTDLVFLSVGRFSSAFKADLDPVLLVFKRLLEGVPNALLILAGSGDEEGRTVEALCTQLGIAGRVRIVTNFPPFIKPTLYGAADVFISIVDNVQETFGIAVVEAMMSGLPVIGSDWSGYRSLIRHSETGFLVRSFWNQNASGILGGLEALITTVEQAKFLAQRTVISSEELLRYMFDLSNNPDLRTEMGQKGRRRAEAHYCWEAVIPRFCKMLAKSARRSRRGPLVARICRE